MAVIGVSVLCLALKILLEIISTTLDTHGLIQAEPLRCSIASSLFILRTAFVCMGMFLVIFNDSSRYGRHNTDQLQSNDAHEIIMLIARNVQRSLGRSVWIAAGCRAGLLLGFGTGNESDVWEIRDTGMHSAYVDRHKGFRDNVDQLFDAS